MDLWTRAVIIETKRENSQQALALWQRWPSSRKRSFARLVERALAKGAQPLLARDPDFPSDWRRLTSGPVGAWLLGSWQAQEQRVGVVGARATPPRVRERVQAYAQACVGQGERLVSGAAVGVDRAAHQGALSQGSIAVVPFGIEADTVGQGQVPVEWLLDGGGCIWAANVLRHGARARFVARNRLLAALCHRLVVAWAAPQSGSMHTVRFAQQLGLPIEAWWHPDDPPGNNGCRVLCSGNELPSELVTLMNQLAGAQGCMARLPHDPSGLRAMQLLELECGGFIRRLDAGTYTLLWSGTV